MKLVTFETGGARHIGALLPGEREAVDFTAGDAAPYFRDMLALIDGGGAARPGARRGRCLARCRARGAHRRQGSRVAYSSAPL